MKPLLALLVIIPLALSCNKDEDPVFIGGKGGNGVLICTPQHHGRNIDSCKIYIKYNTKDAAAKYDDSMMCVNNGARPIATFTGLKKGNYYLFGLGYDTLIHKPVKGGSPYIISDETSQHIDVAVTEEGF